MNKIYKFLIWIFWSWNI